MEPIYFPENTTAAFQLNWSVAIFGISPFPPSNDWLTPLRVATESDNVRILEFRLTKPNVAQFLVSTQPFTSPSQVIRSIKGRIQYLIRNSHPKALRRNYSIKSVGEVNSTVLDQYIRGQLKKHPMAAPNAQAAIENVQYHSPSVDLGSIRTGHYVQFLNSIQIVIENSEGWNEIRESVLLRSRQMILGMATKKSWGVSRIAILSNHLHLLVGLGVTDSPETAALSLLNNLAYAQGMKSVFRFSFYVGTFGSYDRNAIRRQV